MNTKILAMAFGNPKELLHTFVILPCGVDTKFMEGATHFFRDKKMSEYIMQGGDNGYFQ